MSRRLQIVETRTEWLNRIPAPRRVADPARLWSGAVNLPRAVVPLLVLARLALLLSFLTGAQLAHATTFTVLNTNDSGPGSLRQAILDANAIPNVSGPDTIEFTIPTSDLGCHQSSVCTIAPLSGLPPITDPVTIDGTTQPGFSSTPIIELNGASAGDTAVGLELSSTGTVRGLVINRFRHSGILMYDGANHVIEGNYIGTDATGTIALGNGDWGVVTATPRASARIGGTTAGARNVISGNADGIGLFSNSVVQGNYIGTNAAGNAALGNQSRGVFILAGSNNLVGGTVPGAGNVILASDFGIVIDGHAAGPSDGNVVQGNYIGTDATGAITLGNADFGVFLTGDGACDDGVVVSNNKVGGTTAGAGNVIAGSVGAGVGVSCQAIGTEILGNSIFSNGGLEAVDKFLRPTVSARGESC